MLSKLMARDAASQRQRDVENVCFLADRLDLAAELVASDLSLSDVLRHLVQLRALDQVVHVGPGAALPN